MKSFVNLLNNYVTISTGEIGQGVQISTLSLESNGNINKKPIKDGGYKYILISSSSGRSFFIYKKRDKIRWYYIRF